MLMPLGNLFGPENWILIAVAALLVFGRRLPEVGRSLGKGIVEFKKGLQGIEDDIQVSTQPTQAAPRPTITDQTQAPESLPTNFKFDPYTGKPIAPEPVARDQMRFDPYTGKPLQETTAPAGSSNS